MSMSYFCNVFKLLFYLSNRGGEYKIIQIINWLSVEKVDWLEVHMLQSEARRVASKKYLLLCQRKEMSELTKPYSRYKRDSRSRLKHLDKDGFDIVDTLNDGLYMVTKITI